MYTEKSERHIKAMRMVRDAVLLMVMCRPFMDAMMFYAFNTIESQLQLRRATRSSDWFVRGRSFYK
jgi:hypothetical protein